ncbi:hypothetical protein [Thaumasiovibrio sp. DFM-14]|uniref:hypothetical protein n=1 Tax=Thaumasiovibrio sp. DFM-14 TaxID=3384792 RepID=UPI0039A283CA
MTAQKRRIDVELINALNDDLALFAEEHDIDVIDLIVSLKLTLDELADRAGVDLLGIKVSETPKTPTLH